jgi:hypothetical protein
MGKINAYKILVGKHGGKRSLGRHRRRWEVKSRMDLGSEKVWTVSIRLRRETSGGLLRTR